MGDHDSLFKRAFSVPRNAAAEVRSVLPAVAAEQLNLSALELVPASFVDAEMEHRHADLLFRTAFAGRPGYVYFLFEHQSEPDSLMPWRVLEYLQRIWAAVLRAEPKRRSPPPVIPIVVHHGDGGWMAPHRLHELVDGLAELPELRRFVPDFELLIDDLTTVDDDGLQRRPLAPFPKVALWLLRDGRNLKAFFEHLATWGAELERLAREDTEQEDIQGVLRYILRVTGDAPFAVVRQRIAQAAPTLEVSMASLEEQLIQQGIEKGIQKGIQKGIEQGREEGRLDALRATLARLLNARFGRLDAPFQAQIGQASVHDLERWIERVIVAQHIGDIFDA